MGYNISIYLLRSNDLNPDPRVDKYVNYFETTRIPYKLVGWNRNNELIQKVNTDYFNCPANYGAGLKNLWKMVRWNIFLFRYLFARRKYIKLIHACDFDTIIPALFMKIFVNARVVFDVFDWYSDSRNINNRIAKIIICFLEKLAVEKSDYIIICEPERIVQLGAVDRKKVIVMPNIPDFSDIPNLTDFSDSESVISKLRENELKIGYVGILARDRGLEALLNVVSDMPNVILNIAGFGELEAMVLEYDKKNLNIHYEGKVQYNKGLTILSASDCIYAMYYTNVKNHIYAAPNKFYESLYLSKPLITTEGTLVGDKVKKYNTGFVIGESDKDLYTLLKHINKTECLEKGRNAHECWHNEFCNKIQLFFKNDYGPIIEMLYK